MAAKDYTKLTIYINFPLKELKVKYRIHFGLDKKTFITKQDIADWLGNLAEADIEDI